MPNQSDDAHIKLMLMTAVFVGMIVASIFMGGIWGRLFGWRWSFVVLEGAAVLGYLWYRRIKSPAVNTPAPDPGTPPESN